MDTNACRAKSDTFSLPSSTKRLGPAIQFQRAGYGAWGVVRLLPGALNRTCMRIADHLGDRSLVIEDHFGQPADIFFEQFRKLLWHHHLDQRCKARDIGKDDSDLTPMHSHAVLAACRKSPGQFGRKIAGQ